jgi:hypothetical protein
MLQTTDTLRFVTSHPSRKSPASAIPNPGRAATSLRCAEIARHPGQAFDWCAAIPLMERRCKRALLSNFKTGIFEPNP